MKKNGLRETTLEWVPLFLIWLATNEIMSTYLYPKNIANNIIKVIIITTIRTTLDDTMVIVAFVKDILEVAISKVATNDSLIVLCSEELATIVVNDIL